MFKTFTEINDILVEYLDKEKPFSLLRIDNTMGYVLECLHKNELPVQHFYNENTLVEGGIYPSTMEYAYEVVMPLAKKAMINCDILGFVDISQSIRNNQSFVSQFGEKPMFSGVHEIDVLDPAGMLNVTGTRPLDIPWTSKLKDKKVLVISTHCDTINQQWAKIDKVWGDNRKIVAPFELVGTIRSPYHPVMDSRQYPNTNSWLDNVNAIIDKIDSYDYDVLIAGSSTSSPIYATHAASKGKIGIQTGGVHQLFFGILGHRWADVPGYSSWHKMYNEHWTYPLESDEPTNRKNYTHLETNYAYWRK